jgi:hypothetical protein
MSQDYTVIVNFESKWDADHAIKLIYSLCPSAGRDVGQDKQEEFNNVIYDYVLSGTSRTPQEHWDNILKPTLGRNICLVGPCSIEFHIMTASGLQCIETITP